MLRLPDDPFVSLELVHDPDKGAVDLGTRINHLVVQVASLRGAIAELGRYGIVADASPFILPDEPGPLGVDASSGEALRAQPLGRT